MEATILKASVLIVGVLQKVSLVEVLEFLVVGVTLVNLWLAFEQFSLHDPRRLMNYLAFKSLFGS
jgi:hypothetical protein